MKAFVFFSMLVAAAAAISVKAAPAYHVPEADVKCTICEELAQAIEGYVAENKTETEIITLLDKLCDKLGLLKPVCDTIVTTYAPQLISLIEQKESPDVVCKQIGLCKNMTGVWEEPARNVGSVKCTICEQLAQAIEGYIAENKTETEIITLLDKLCAGLGPLKGTCDTIVSAYAPQLIQLLEAKESPDVVCKQIGLCKNMTNTWEEAARLAAKGFGGVKCTICEELAQAIEGYIAENKTETEIIALLDKLCAGLGALKGTCDSVVSAYAPQLIQLLEQKESPDVVCKQIGLCKNMTNVWVETARLAAKSALNIKCTICEKLAQAIEGYIAENKTETEIITLLDKVCSGLGALKGTCDTIVSAYAPQLIQLLEEKESPDVVCKQVGLCKNATAAADFVAEGARRQRAINMLLQKVRVH